MGGQGVVAAVELLVKGAVKKRHNMHSLFLSSAVRGGSTS